MKGSGLVNSPKNLRNIDVTKTSSGWRGRANVRLARIDPRLEDPCSSIKARGQRRLIATAALDSCLLLNTTNQSPFLLIGSPMIPFLFRD